MGCGHHRVHRGAPGAWRRSVAREHHQRRVQLLAGGACEPGDRGAQEDAAGLCYGDSRRPGAEDPGRRPRAGRRHAPCRGRQDLCRCARHREFGLAGESIHAKRRVHPVAQDRGRGARRGAFRRGDSQPRLRWHERVRRQRPRGCVSHRHGHGVRQDREPHAEHAGGGESAHAPAQPPHEAGHDLCHVHGYRVLLPVPVRGARAVRVIVHLRARYGRGIYSRRPPAHGDAFARHGGATHEPPERPGEEARFRGGARLHECDLHG